VKMSHAAV